MTTYNVHLYRVMRLFFPEIEADAPEQAAQAAAHMDFDDAADFSDCDGENREALVDLIGDIAYSQSVLISLNDESLILHAQSSILDLLRYGKATIADGELIYDGTVYAYDDANPDWSALYGALIASAASHQLPELQAENPARE